MKNEDFIKHETDIYEMICRPGFEEMKKRLEQIERKIDIVNEKMDDHNTKHVRSISVLETKVKYQSWFIGVIITLLVSSIVAQVVFKVKDDNRTSKQIDNKKTHVAANYKK